MIATRRGTAWGALALVATGVGVLVAAAAPAQTIDVARPRTLVAGTPPGARAARVDGARTGSSKSPLPTGSLSVAWQTPALGVLIDGAPVVDASGTTYLVGTRGEVVAIARDGGERWRASTGAVQPGPSALLSDDTLVFADALGEAVAVREGVVRWRTRFGRGDTVHPAPLPLGDGGVVVATAHDLAALDIEGHERARVTLPEAAAGPLVAAPGKVLATGASGVVWSWTPGATEAVRAGSFGAPLEGGAVLVDDHTLAGVTADGARLSALDLTTAVASTRALSGGGLWLGPPAARAGTLYLMLLTPSAELAVGLDAAGAEVMRSRVATRIQPLTADGGVPPLATVPHAPPLVDASGTLAFATPEGGLGTVSAGTVELLDGACTGAGRAPSAEAGRIAGLAPLTPGIFVAACHSGALIALRGASTPGESAAGHL
jgi:outer membrane protein assembly factor BamB